jgi:hypothetical protein
MIMGEKKIFHLELKADKRHRYYGSLSALFKNNTGLSVSKFTLDRWDWSNSFENDVCIIRKSMMVLSSRAAKKRPAKKRKNDH